MKLLISLSINALSSAFFSLHLWPEYLWKTRIIVTMPLSRSDMLSSEACNKQFKSMALPTNMFYFHNRGVVIEIILFFFMFLDIKHCNMMHACNLIGFKCIKINCLPEIFSISYLHWKKILSCKDGSATDGLSSSMLTASPSLQWTLNSID